MRVDRDARRCAATHGGGRRSRVAARGRERRDGGGRSASRARGAGTAAVARARARGVVRASSPARRPRSSPCSCLSRPPRGRAARRTSHSRHSRLRQRSCSPRRRSRGDPGPARSPSRLRHVDEAAHHDAAAPDGGMRHGRRCEGHPAARAVRRDDARPRARVRRRERTQPSARPRHRPADGLAHRGASCRDGADEPAARARVRPRSVGVRRSSCSPRR